MLQLLGFPIQLFGLLLLPYLGVKYLDLGDDYSKDFKTVAVSLHRHLTPLWCQRRRENQ